MKRNIISRLILRLDKFPSYMVVIYLLLFGVIGLMGVVLNLNTMHFNGCRMPVHTDLNISTSRHFSYQYADEVNYSIFTDWIYVPEAIMSIGDYLILSSIFGVFIFIGARLIIHWSAKYIINEPRRTRKV